VRHHLSHTDFECEVGSFSDELLLLRKEAGSKKNVRKAGTICTIGGEQAGVVDQGWGYRCGGRDNEDKKPWPKLEGVVLEFLRQDIVLAVWRVEAYDQVLTRHPNVLCTIQLVNTWQTYF